ncbi:probable sodium/metabolite cotransporter BASS4, chloroplastic isoform X2 [Phoenix dactylifera]|uniref:Probable sodium/metabolite cotransporter BASS4, chloroplastic isoform X2 n=1 Tax=Phoenix dactylifera TaxID=42345 RepID=A0A8B7BRQ7_PHODC|nr:probable sodium/metabolite cotransporter BASS4, chloroplastic isoform X2 [Phoenix dactylifera]
MAVGSLQTLAFRPPSAARNSVSGRRIASFPANLFSFSREFLIAIAPPSLFAKSRPVARCPRAIGGSGKVYGDGNYQSKDSNTRKVFSWTQPLLDFVGTNFLPLALVSGITLGLINPTLGCLAHKYSLSRFSACGIFFISGLMLHSGELGAAIEAWPAGLFGLGSILLFTPFFSRLILQIQLMPHEFVTGLAIFCCMPTTLSSGVTLTRVPFSISRYIGAGAGVSVPTLQLFKSLITNLVVPLILGKVIRDSSERMAEYVDRNLRSFAMISAVLLSLVPWMQVSRSRSLLLTVKPAMFAIAIGMGTLLHLILLAFNTLTVSSLSLVSGGSKSVFAKKDNARAVIVVASQKTLPVLVAVVEQLGRAFGEPGLLVLPCVASHINQILIDSFMVNLWLWKDRLSANTKEA